MSRSVRLALNRDDLAELTSERSESKLRGGVAELWGPRGLLFERCHVRDKFIGRVVGLLGRSALDDDEAMLITRCRSVHTLAMRFPIDIIFLGGDLRVISTKSRVPPWRSPRGVHRARHVLEARAGSIEDLGISIGETLALRCPSDA